MAIKSQSPVKSQAPVLTSQSHAHRHSADLDATPGRAREVEQGRASDGDSLPDCKGAQMVYGGHVASKQGVETAVTAAAEDSAVVGVQDAARAQAGAGAAVGGGDVVASGGAPSWMQWRQEVIVERSKAADVAAGAARASSPQSPQRKGSRQILRADAGGEGSVAQEENVVAASETPVSGRQTKTTGAGGARAGTGGAGSREEGPKTSGSGDMRAAPANRKLFQVSMGGWVVARRC